MKKPAKIFTTSVKLYISLLILSTIAILYGTLFPADYNLPDSIWSYDKVAHFVMFGVWTFFFGIVRFLKGNYSLFPVFLLSALFGVIVEMLQYLLPTNRSAELFDLVADVTGSGFAILLLYMILKNVSEFKSEATS
ncbi:MAG: VanZ family protein [Balneolaceae bacterium]